MSISREDILKELGLTPVWRLRTPVESAAADGASASPALDLTDTAAGGPAAPQKNPAPEQITVRGLPKVPPLDARATQIATLEWPQLKESVARCVACPLHKGRTQTVFGVGDEAADWLFVGEGPGAEEDAKGEPFVGPAGKLLDNMLAAVKLKRGRNVYIANVVKCRPPDNRNPETGEAAQCEPYLQRQIALIKPKLIVALGKVAAVNLLKRDAAVASMRGKIHQYQGIPLIVTYHPAYLLRSLPEKAKAWVDLCFAVETMEGLQSDK